MALILHFLEILNSQYRFLLCIMNNYCYLRKTHVLYQSLNDTTKNQLLMLPFVDAHLKQKVGNSLGMIMKSSVSRKYPKSTYRNNKGCSSWHVVQRTTSLITGGHTHLYVRVFVASTSVHFTDTRIKLAPQIIKANFGLMDFGS